MPKLKIAFAADIPPDGEKFLREALREHAQYIELVSFSENPQYLFKTVDQSFQLISTESELPVFKKIQGISYSSATEILTKTEIVAKWEHVLRLSSPSSSIRKNEIKVELFLIDEPGNYDDNAPANNVSLDHPVSFAYEFTNGTLHHPAFRLKITNTSDRNLWVHALFLKKDFSISDKLLPEMELKPGEEVWLYNDLNGIPQKTIPLQIKDEFLSSKITEISEFIKLFVSTEALELHLFNQVGLKPDVPTKTTRSIGGPRQISHTDWTTQEIELLIRGPIEDLSEAEPEETSGAEPESEIPEIEEPGSSEPTIISPAPEPEASIKLETSQPTRSAPPKSESSSVGNKLKNWFRGLTKSKSKKSEGSFSDADFDELEEAAPPLTETGSTISERLDKMLEEVVSPENELPEALKKEDSGDQVDCSIYAPPTAQKGDDVFVQVWLHLPQLSQKVHAFATEFDEEASQRAFQSLKVPLEKGEELSLVLEAKGIEIDEKVQHINWNGDVQSAQFIASVPEDFQKNKTIFTLRVFKGEIPVGHIKFILKITSQTVESEPQPLGNEARRYKKAFVSYSSQDRNEVLKRVQMLDKVGIEFFQDVLSLNPGERWEQKLYENIDDADVFFLFWSSAAKKSKWVLQELEYAIKQKQGNEENPPFIKPVPIEGPPIVKPPEQLGHMHFNDRILYFILKKQ